MVRFRKGRDKNKNFLKSGVRRFYADKKSKAKKFTLYFIKTCFD